MRSRSGRRVGLEAAIVGTMGIVTLAAIGSRVGTGDLRETESPRPNIGFYSPSNYQTPWTQEEYAASLLEGNTGLPGIVVDDNEPFFVNYNFTGSEPLDLTVYAASDKQRISLGYKLFHGRTDAERFHTGRFLVDAQLLPPGEYGVHTIVRLQNRVSYERVGALWVGETLDPDPVKPLEQSWHAAKPVDK